MKLSEMNRAQLRSKCDSLGIKWVKTEGTEALIARIREFRRKEAEVEAEPAPELPVKKAKKGEKKPRITIIDEGSDEGGEPVDDGPDKSIKDEWNLKERAELDTTPDKRSGKKRKRPVDCFGWLHANTAECAICPHGVPCKKLSAEADLGIFAEDLAEEAVPAEEEPVEAAKALPGPSKKAKPEPLTEKSKVSVQFDVNYVKKNVDAELQDFYKAVFKRLGKGACKVRQVIDVFGEFYEIEDRDTILTDLVATMVENKELVRV